VLLSERFKNTRPKPPLPAALDLDRVTQKRVFFSLAGFAGSALSLYALAFWLRDARAEALEVAIVALLIAAGVGLSARAGSYQWPLRGLVLCLFAWLTWNTLKQGTGLAAAAWWLSVVPFILAGAGMHYLAIASVLSFVATVVLLYSQPGWLPLPAVAPIEPWRRLFAVIGSELLALSLIIVAMRSRARVAQALEAARRTASEAAELKARFLANMSHEIRTPLTGIIGAAEVLDARGVSDAQRARLLSMQRQSAQTLLALVNDVLDFAKLEAGKVRLELQPVSLRGIVFESIELYSMQAFAKKIEISSSCNPDVPQHFLGDPLRLRQVVNNLVSNAVKFTQRGGVHVHLSVDPDDTPAGSSGKRWIRIEVVDSGSGIPAHQQRDLFGAFVQADSSVTRRFGGTGLGLSIAQELCRLMEGRIEVRSVVGEGSRFSVLVPLAQRSPNVTLRVPSHRADLLLATSNSGLQRHLKTLLNELEIDPIVLDRLPDRDDLGRCSILLVDAPLLAEISDVGGWMSAYAGNDRRIAVLTPLGGEGLLGSGADAHVLYKPVGRRSLETFLAPDHATRSTLHPVTEEPARPLAGLRVLVAEDNAVNQVVLQAMLAELGATCVIASNGKEALACTASESFDVVLMDVNMPELDGLSVARALRAREAGVPTVKILATTATTDRDALEACIAAGMDAWLSKPFDLTDLCGALQSLTYARVQLAKPTSPD
jgi:signal transduction histidine kinase/CheY-like chemotaxis protein